jgi:subtilase family serine protease
LKRLALLAAAAAAVTSAALAATAAAAPVLHAIAGLPAVQGPALTAAAGSAGPGCDPHWAAVGVACLSPADLAAVYDFPKGLDGRGQTIVVVDAYGSPTLQADVDAFDGLFGLPATTVQVVRGPSTGATDGSGQLGTWAVETSLDVEYAHAMAPGARIVLAQAASDDVDDLLAATSAAVAQYPGAIVSLSFGGDETDPTSGPSFARWHALFAAGTAAGDTFVAAAGDFGATNCPDPSVCSPSDAPVAQFPASDPLVLAVGGTMASPYGGVQAPGLFGSGLDVNGGYGGEQVWNEPWLGAAATGGAPSVLFSAPSWQAPFSQSSQRIVPDVSYNASIAGGVEIVAGGHLALIGGTSAAAPQWAAVVAVADQGRGASGIRPLGLVAPDLYRLASDPRTYARDFHDVTSGSNALFGVFAGFAAGTGFDDATGLGSPDVAHLVADLHGVQPNGNPSTGGIHPPATGHAGAHGKSHVLSPG